MRHLSAAIALIAIAASGAIAQTYSNGPLVTHPGGGFGGADASALETAIGLGTYGSNVSASFGIADDFTIPCGESWLITNLRFFAYQTGTTTTSTITSVNYRIYDGDPSAGGNVVYDYSTSNSLVATAWTNMYRSIDTNLLASTRPVMSVDAAGNGIVLGSGTWWIFVRVGGSTTSGPWAPPISILGTQVTGNAKQYISSTSTWQNMTSGAALHPQGLPFEVSYVPSGWNFAISQPGGAGADVHFDNVGGTAGNSYFNAITLNGTNFPTGWFSGIDASIFELVAEVQFGAPFYGGLDACGEAHNVIVGPMPSGITVYHVSLHLGGAGTPIAVTAPGTYTTL